MHGLSDASMHSAFPYCKIYRALGVAQLPEHPKNNVMSFIFRVIRASSNTGIPQPAAQLQSIFHAFAQAFERPHNGTMIFW